MPMPVRISGLFLFAIVGLLMTSGCGQQAQIGADPKCFKSVDALWTAVGTKRTDLLSKAEEDLKSLHSAGLLPNEAHAALESIIETAKGGDWKSARSKLRAFMAAQRRGR